MKPKVNALRQPLARPLASAAFAIACMLAVPVMAQTATSEQSESAPVPLAPETRVLASNAPAGAAVPSSAATKASRTSREARVEARIADLRSKLKITPEQEDRFNQFAQVMRDNATSMDALARERFANRQTMTAVDDLAAYSDVTAAHAEGLKKLLPAFEALYTSLSEAQKMQADASFRGPSRSAARKGSRNHS